MSEKLYETIEISNLKDMLNKTKNIYGEKPAYKIKQEEGGGKDHEAVLLLYGGKIEQGAADGRALPWGLWIRTER